MVGDRHVLNIITGVVLGEGDLGKLWNGWSFYSVCSLFGLDVDVVCMNPVSFGITQVAYSKK